MGLSSCPWTAHFAIYLMKAEGVQVEVEAEACLVPIWSETLSVSEQMWVFLQLLQKRLSGPLGDHASWFLQFHVRD